MRNMLKLINAYSRYNRLVNYIQWPVILVLVIANAINGGLENRIAAVMFYMAIFLGIIEATEEIKSRRIRLLAGLPVPVRTLGLYRHFGLFVGWTSWMTLLFLSSVISRGGQDIPAYLWQALGRIGGMFVFVGFMSLATDLVFCFRETRRNKILGQWVVAPILIISGIFFGPILYFSVLSTPRPEGGNNLLVHLFSFVTSTPGALGYFVVGLAALALDAYCFERRRSYLEDSVYPT
jgi:hypothetical protein